MHSVDEILIGRIGSRVGERKNGERPDIGLWPTPERDADNDGEEHNAEGKGHRPFALAAAEPGIGNTPRGTPERLREFPWRGEAGRG